MIRVLAQASRGALALPAEYSFERLDFCSQHRVLSVAHNNHAAFINEKDYRGPRFQSKPVISPNRPAPQAPATYVWGSGLARPPQC